MKYATTILVFCVAALLSLGLVMLYSSSMSQSGATYPVAQVIWCGLGLLAAGGVACVDYRHLKKISLPLFLLAIARGADAVASLPAWVWEVIVIYCGIALGVAIKFSASPVHNQNPFQPPPSRERRA